MTVKCMSRFVIADRCDSCLLPSAVVLWLVTAVFGAVGALESG